VKGTPNTMRLLLLFVLLCFAHIEAKAKEGQKHKLKHKKQHKEMEEHVVHSTPAQRSFGDRLLRTFGVFKAQPTNPGDAEQQGFSIFTDGCTQFGHGYSSGTDGPTKGSSAILYFTEGGQLSGFGTRLWGDVPDDLVPDYWVPNGDGSYDLIIQTRASDFICSGDTDDNLLGDRVLINGEHNIPLSMPAAQGAGWVEGNCIPKMGIHHAFDLSAPGSQTWDYNSLVPVMPMYNAQTGAITAVLIASSDAQRIEPFGDWEGPFINYLFCKNWCSGTGCDFPGVSLWTTMHWLFEDPSLNTCTGAKCSL